QSRAVVSQLFREESGKGLRPARLGQIAEINPGLGGARPESVVAFYGMADLSEAGVFRFAPQMRDFDAVRTGFTRFRRGDVLVAKITPCFENGKAGHLVQAPTDVCFGSTEFHVLRAKEVPPEVIAAVVRHPVFRERGASSMTGSAGQQRVPAQFLRDFPLTLPDDDQMQRMAAVLGTASRRAGLLDAYVTNLQAERRALMTQLLSGALQSPPRPAPACKATEAVNA
ncbi:MAG: hypothetical protein Q7U75_13125, partial [Desulfobacterales bacterium]|nr:hypothetical protein [Desulfobacterales bacterium]